MPTAVIDGIATRYEVVGSGPPLLMFSPAGFDATLDKWATQGVYARARLLVAEMCRTLFDRDTARGAEPEALLRLEIPALIVPGRDPRTRHPLPATWRNACPRRNTGTSRPKARPNRAPPRGCSSSSTERALR